MIRFLTLAVLVLTPAQLWAGPMEIESDRMVFQHKTERAEFISNVYLKRDDVELWCDRLLAYYKNSQLQRAEAFGHVRLAQKDIRGKSDKAVFDHKKNRLTMIGNAELEQSGSKVQGETIIHDLSGEKTTVQPAKGSRARMIIESDPPESKPAGKEAN